MSATPIPPRPFDARRFRRLMAFDNAARWSSAAVIALCIMLGPAVGADSGITTVLMMLMIGGLWAWLSSISTRTWRESLVLPLLIEQNPIEADKLLTRLVECKPLQRQVRLGLMHRLAMLRHRQQRYRETDAICRALLAQRLGASERVRPHLLLMMVEANLLENNLVGAYQGLIELGYAPLSLMETLQRLALQTRYELASDRPDAVLWLWHHKVSLAELMPAPQCGAMHNMLAQAADRAGQTSLAAWLRGRAELLGGADLDLPPLQSHRLEVA